METQSNFKNSMGRAAMAKTVDASASHSTILLAPRETLGRSPLIQSVLLKSSFLSEGSVSLLWSRNAVLLPPPLLPLTLQGVGSHRPTLLESAAARCQEWHPARPWWEAQQIIYPPDAWRPWCGSPRKSMEGRRKAPWGKDFVLWLPIPSGGGRDHLPKMPAHPFCRCGLYRLADRCGAEDGN